MARKTDRSEFTLLGKVGAWCLVIAAVVVLSTWSDSKPTAVSWGVVGFGAAIWFLRADARLRERRRKRARAAIEVPHHIRILEDCVRLCQESKNAKTRVSRAELGIEKIVAIEDLKPRTVKNRGDLTRYFSAVIKCADIEGAYTKAIAAKTTRTRKKNLEAARYLLRHSTVGDEDLEAAKAADPRTGEILKISTILSAPDEVELTPAPPPRATSPPPLPTEVAREPAPRKSAPLPRSPTPTSSPKKARRDRASCWLAPGEPTKVQGYVISGGMIYVGRSLPEVRQHGDVDPALINPDLHVKKARPDHAGERMGYWPSYSRIPPSCRAAYLEWLAGDRDDPTAYIGYVFLFFYGLERRALVDAEADGEAAGDLPSIRAEVERLLSIYGGNGSFKRYASGLLELLDARASSGGVDTAPTPWRQGYELPLDMRLSIGRIAMRGEKLSTSWAFAWVTSDPEFRLRTPAIRCPSEFESLFRVRYAQQHGDGIALRVRKSTVPLEYHPASSSFGGAIRFETDVPDVTKLVGPRRKLDELVIVCCDELAPYSRWRGRNPGEEESLDAVALVPDAIFEEHAPAPFKTFRSKLNQLLGEQERTVVPASPLLDEWLTKEGGRLKKKSSIQVAQLMAHAGVGLVPDARLGKRSIASSDHVVLFRLEEGDAEYVAPSPSFAAAGLLLHLAAMVAAADGSIADDERRKLKSHLSADLDIEDAERRRLAAQLELFLHQPPGIAGVKKRVEALPPEQRTAIAEFLVDVALADGRIDTGEVRVLTKIFKVLELDPAAVHDALHQARTSEPGAGPILVSPAAPSAGARAIPVPPPGGPDQQPVPAPKRRSLDMAAVQAKLTETAAVASLLSGIFEDEGEEPPRPEPPADDARVDGLDAAHASLLLGLGKQDSWSRDDYGSLADSLGLLPDGALEVLNDLAFDKCGVPLSEGDDPIEIDKETFEELTS